MQKNHKSKKNSLDRLHLILDNGSRKDYESKDKKYLISLTQRLKESSGGIKTYKKAATRDVSEFDEDSMKAKVTLHAREVKKPIIIEEKKPEEAVEFPEIKEEVKEEKYEEEDVFEIEKVEISEPKFIEVKPKVPEKQEEEAEIEKEKVEEEKELTEWEPVEIKKEEPQEELPEPLEVNEKEETHVELPTPTEEVKKEEVEEEKLEKKEEVEPTPVFIPVEKVEEKEEQIEIEKVTPKVEEEIIEEPGIDREIKIEVFKDIESIDEETSVLLYDNGFTTVDSLTVASLKDLIKIKGIKRKTAKKIKKEVEQKYEWQPVDTNEEISNETTTLEKMEEPLDIAIGETAEGELTEKQVEEEEDIIEKEVKIEVFKDMESIDEETSVLLYDNGFTTVDSLTVASLKDLIKIKGIKRKTAKKIKKEVEQKYEWQPVDTNEEISNETTTLEKMEEPLDIAIGETAEGELTEKQVEEEEDIIEKEVKIEAFKDMESIDDKTAILFFDSGFTTIDYLKEASLKDLIKIKGIKRKVAKKIKEEIDKKIEESAEAKPIAVEETAEGEVTKEQVQEEEKDDKTKEVVPSPVELTAESAEWEPVEIKKEKPKRKKRAKKKEPKVIEEVEPVEPEDMEFSEQPIDEASEIDEKIIEYEPEKTEEDFLEEKIEEATVMKADQENVFKDIKSIDEKIANLLLENKIDSIGTLHNTTIKELTKIKGIKKKIAKQIKKEVNELVEKTDTIEEESFERGKNPFINEEEEEEDEWDSYDEDKISDTTMKGVKGYMHKDYTLYKKEIEIKSGKKRTVRFFSKGEPEEGSPIKLPKGYEVKENKKTGLPYLKKKK